jgi:hypothetical protein
VSDDKADLVEVPGDREQRLGVRLSDERHR